MTTLDRFNVAEFRFFRPDAREVAVAGDFNNWSCQLPMRRDADGWWTLRLTLKPGDYRFRYLADNEWFADYASNGIEKAKVGWNSLLVIPDLSAPSNGEKRASRVAYGTIAPCPQTMSFNPAVVAEAGAVSLSY